MKKLIALLLCICFPVAVLAAENQEATNSYKVKYDGGSIATIKANANLKIFVDKDVIRLVPETGEAIVIPAASVTELSYGQDVHRRVGAAIGVAVFSLGVGALLALTKSKKHFIGIVWDDNGKKGGIAIQADKNDYRGLLMGLEGVTGKKATDSSSLTVKN